MNRAAIFDIDGTLIDSVDFHAKAWHRAFAAFGKDIPVGQVRAQIGKGGDQLMPVFLSSEELRRFGAELEQYQGAVYHRDYFPLVRAFPDVRCLFQQLRRDGKRLALASSAKAEDMATCQRIANIEDLVDVTVSADDVQHSKPSPDLFTVALKRLGIDAPDAVAVGDTPYDAEAAVSAGISVIGMLCGGFAENGLFAAGCSQTYRDPADLLAKYSLSLFGERAFDAPV